MMTTVGSYQLKTNLARFLDKVAKGEVIEITRHGTVIAKLVPSQPKAHYSKRQASVALKKMQRVKLRGTSIRSLINHGRKH